MRNVLSSDSKCWNLSCVPLAFFVVVVQLVLLRVRTATGFQVPLVGRITIGSSSSSRGERTLPQLSLTSLDNNYYDDEKQQLSSSSSSSSSVGDYVQGVHGSKYQFEEFGGATYEGRQFAEALYSSVDTTTSATTTTKTATPEGPIPLWAEKMGTTKSRLGMRQPLYPPTTTTMGREEGGSGGFPVLSISSSSSEPTTSITITNDERSWEYYYCKLVEVSSIDGTILDDSIHWCHETDNDNINDAPSCCPIMVTPSVGQLAPRGGSSNLCDPSKPYSDSVTIHLQRNNACGIDNINNHLLFVVGTEAETWPYWIQFV